MKKLLSFFITFFVFNNIWAGTITVGSETAGEAIIYNKVYLQYDYEVEFSIKEKSTENCLLQNKSIPAFSFKDKREDVVYFPLLNHLSSSSHDKPYGIHVKNHDDVFSQDVFEIAAVQLAHSLGILDDKEYSLLWSHPNGVSKPPIPTDANIRGQHVCTDRLLTEE